MKKIIFYLSIVGIIFNLFRVEALPPSMDADSWPADLNLTPEQIRTLTDLKVTFRQEQEALQKKMMIKRMELRTLSPEEFRDDKGEELRRQIQSLLLQARERALFYQQEAFMALTPEQKKKLPANSDMGFRCRGMFRRGGGPGMGKGKGAPEPAPAQETWPRSLQP